VLEFLSNNPLGYPLAHSASAADCHAHIVLKAILLARAYSQRVRAALPPSPHKCEQRLVLRAPWIGPIGHAGASAWPGLSTTNGSHMAQLASGALTVDEGEHTFHIACAEHPSRHGKLRIAISEFQLGPDQLRKPTAALGTREAQLARMRAVQVWRVAIAGANVCGRSYRSWSKSQPLYRPSPVYRRGTRASGWQRRSTARVSSCADWRAASELQTGRRSGIAGVPRDALSGQRRNTLAFGANRRPDQFAAVRMVRSTRPARFSRRLRESRHQQHASPGA
jgi:hypothetical protein